MLPENLPRLVLNSGYGPDLHVHVIEETGGGGGERNKGENSIQVYELMLICFTFIMWPILKNMVDLENVVNDRGCHALGNVFQLWFASVLSAYPEIPLRTR